MIVIARRGVPGLRRASNSGAKSTYPVIADKRGLGLARQSQIYALLYNLCNGCII